jgi:hypothetical protein
MSLCICIKYNICIHIYRPVTILPCFGILKHSIRDYCLPNWWKITNIEYVWKRYQVNLFLFLIKYHAMRMYGEPWHWMEVSGRHHAPTADILGREFAVPIEYEIGWTQSQYGPCGEEKSIYPYRIWNLDFSIVQPGSYCKRIMDFQINISADWITNGVRILCMTPWLAI